MARKVLVTGGAGFIGSHLAEALVHRGDDVVVVDNLSTGTLDNLETVWDRIRFIHGDLSDPEMAKEAVRGCEIVFHHAAIASVQRSLDDPLGCHASGTTATMNVLWAATEAGARRVIFAGSAAAYGREQKLPHSETMLPDPQSPYAATKVAGEYYLKSFSFGKGLDTVSLRYFNIYGPRQDPGSSYSGVIAIFAKRMITGERPIIYGDGEQSRDFFYVADAVQANLLAADYGKPLEGEIFNVGCGQQITINQLVAEINQILSSHIIPVFETTRVGEVRHSRADIGKIQKVLGYTPRVSLREGLTKLIGSMRLGIKN